jgi:hypothetical protein
VEDFMFRISVPLAMIAVVSLTGCATSTADRAVRSEYVETTNFQEWKTFRFSTDGGTGTSNYPRYEKMVLQALEEELTARGYTRIEDGAPDFRVAFDLVFRGDTTPQMTPEGGGAEPRARSYAGQAPSGSLNVRMLDPLTSKILWTGSISEIRMTAIEPYKELKKAVWRILVEFPPLAG